MLWGRVLSSQFPVPSKRRRLEIFLRTENRELRTFLMNSPSSAARYNQPIQHMRAREFRRKLRGNFRRKSSGLRMGWLTSFLLATFFLPSSLLASGFGDAARQLAQKISASSGPGAFALEITNRSSLDEKSVREVSSALQAGLDVEGVHITKAEQATGTVEIVLSESLRDYVWTAEITIGSDEKKVVMVSLPRPPAEPPFAPAFPIVLKTTFLLSQERPMLDFALVDMPGGSRLIVLEADAVSVYRHQGAIPGSSNSAGNSTGRWQLEASLPIAHSRPFPRDLRGRLLLRRDHLFDVYLPGTFCRTNSSPAAPLTIACNDSDDPWPLAPVASLGSLGSDDNGVRAFFASKRNFFTGALSPAIGKISNVPSFYSAAALPRSNYTLWAFAAVDGSLHLVDGVTDQAIRGVKWGSDVAAVHSSCGGGTQLLASEVESPRRGEKEHDDLRTDLRTGLRTGLRTDDLRAYEIPDRDPVAVSAAVEFVGQIAALWPESAGNGAAAIVRRTDTGWYEAYSISVFCGN
jgi:hypothetical protein